MRFTAMPGLLRPDGRLGGQVLPGPIQQALRGAFLVPWIICLCSAWGAALAGNPSSAGLTTGYEERDTVRLDRRMEGAEERVMDARVSEQKIGYEERKIRLERRAEELLRVEEQARQRVERFREEEEKAAEVRRRERERIDEKQKKVQVTPGL